MRRHSKSSFYLLVATVLLAHGCFGSDCSNNTNPETCEGGDSVAGVTGIELGLYTNDVFSPLADNDIVDLVYGGQGAAMVPVSLRISGTNLPTCMPQLTIVYDDREESIGQEDQAIQTHVDGDARYTKSLYVILGFSNYEGMRARIEATVGAQMVSRTVHFSFIGSVDAGLPVDADPFEIDASEADATTHDAALEDAAPSGDAMDLDAAN